MNIHQLLKKYNFSTKKSLGQNFLHEEHFLDTIIDAGEVSENDTVVEVGPGLGPLTEKLCKTAQNVTAIEMDSTLCGILNDRFASQKNLTVIEGDALEFSPKDHNLTPHNYKLIANIPYYITSPLINHFLKDQDTPPSTIVILIQKEVAEKICNTKKRFNVLALNVHTFGHPTLIEKVPKDAFTPAPKVDSAIIKIDVHKSPKVSCDLNLYFKLIHAGFSQKRKKLHNALTRGLSLPTETVITQLEKAGIDPNRRAENLSIAEWETITNVWEEA